MSTVIKHLSRNILFAYKHLSEDWIYQQSKRLSMSLKAALDPVQERLLAEPCILVDDHDKPIGKASKKDCHLMSPQGEPPPLHRAFSVFLFNTAGELLLQQRADCKITFPAFYTNTCCSHPLFVEEELDENNAFGVKFAAQRRLNYELGIPTNQIDINDFTYLTRIKYASPSSGKWGEHEIDYILILRKDVDLNPNENEVQKVQYVKRQDFDVFLKKLREENIPITPWFALIVSRFLPTWWESLDKIEDFLDHESIHALA